MYLRLEELSLIYRLSQRYRRHLRMGVHNGHLAWSVILDCLGRGSRAPRLGLTRACDMGLRHGPAIWACDIGPYMGMWHGLARWGVCYHYSPPESCLEEWHTGVDVPAPCRPPWRIMNGRLDAMLVSLPCMEDDGGIHACSVVEFSRFSHCLDVAM